MITFPPFRLDPAEERLWRDDEVVALRRKPFAILTYLVANPRRLVTHEELLGHVWGGQAVSESAVRTHLHELRQVLGDGVIETVVGRGYRFVAELGPARPDPLPARAADRSVVGRAAELALLTATFESAQTGHRQLCFVTGEPGIGKTTLIDAFLSTLESRKVVAVRGHCLEQYGTPEAYFAVIELLGRLQKSARGNEMIAALVRYAPTFLLQVPHLIPEGQHADVARRAGSGSEARMMRELVEALESMATVEPLVLVLEDVQWSDVATIDLLSLLGQRRERACLMVVVTSRRAEAQTVTHPLNRVMRGLIARSGAIAVPLGRIEVSAVREFIDLRFPEHTFPASFLDVVDRITAGTPLFVVSLLDDLVGRGMIDRSSEHWQLTTSIDQIASYRPDSVRQLIDIQLDRLIADEQRVLEAASLLGTQFSVALVAAALGIPVEQADETCTSLARRGLFLRSDGFEEWPDGTIQARYAVTHALVQEVSFERCTPTRRQRWHRSIAEHLDAAYGEHAPEISHLLATHYEHGHVVSRALHYFVIAAERTSARWAIHDASRLFRRALALVRSLPETRERDAVELRTLVGISQSVLFINDSSHEPVTLFERMIAIAQRLDDVPQVFAAKVNLCFRYATLADYRKAAALDEEIAELARTATIPAELIAFASCSRGLFRMWKGDLERSERALVEAIDDRTVNSGPIGILGAADRKALFLSHLGTVQWLRGEPDRAVSTIESAIAHATRSSDPYSLGSAYCILARIRFWRRDPPEEIRDTAARTLAMPEAEVWQPQAQLLVAAARLQINRLDATELDDVVRVFRARTAAFPMGTTALGLYLIDLFRRADRIADARSLIQEMLEFTRERDERIFEAEYLRLRGELVQPTDPASAERDYLAALSVARELSARMYELRAAANLVGLRRSPEHRVHLEHALAAITEGFETPDLIEARALLE